MSREGAVEPLLSESGAATYLGMSIAQLVGMHLADPGMLERRPAV